MTIFSRIKEAMNPYASSEKKGAEPDWQEVVAERVRKDLAQLAEMSAEMLQDQRYTKIRQLYQRILEQNMRLLIHYDPPNGVNAGRMEVYFDTMRKIQQQVRVLSQIVEMPKEFVAKAEQVKEMRAPVSPMKSYEGKTNAG